MIDAIGVALAYLLQFIFYGIDSKRNVCCKQSYENGKYKSKHKNIQQRICLNNQLSGKSYVIHNFSPFIMQSC